MFSLIGLQKGQYGRPSVTKGNKPYKPFLPTYSPQEGHLQEGEDMLSSIEESWGNVADYSKGNEDNHEQYLYSQTGSASSRDTRKEELFQHFYQVLQKAWDREGPSDCIIVSINKEQREYATAIGHRLRDHGLVVETIHLASDLGLTRILQEVKDDGSPFCILVEQSNVKCSSCTVIMLRESINIHRHMPLEDALMLVTKEFRRFFETRSTGISQRATDLVDDFMAREGLCSYCLPSGIQHLLFLLSEGKHLYREELSLIIDYLETRKEQLEGLKMLDPSASRDPSSFQGRSTPTVDKPPPLLPTLGTFVGASPPGSAKSLWLGNRRGRGLLPLPGPANPKGLFPSPLLPAGPSRRPGSLGHATATPAKCPLLGEKPGPLLPPPGGATQVESSTRVLAARREMQLSLKSEVAVAQMAASVSSRPKLLDTDVQALVFLAASPLARPTSHAPQLPKGNTPKALCGRLTV